MAIRLTGISSGMDTDAMVQELTKAYQTNVDKAKGEKEKLKWKKEAWSALNTKLYNFYTGALSDFRSTGTYKTKKVTSSADSKVSFSSSPNAVNGTHKLSVKSLASAAYLTGAKISVKSTSQTTSYKATSGSTSATALLDDKGNAKDISGTHLTVKGADGTTANLSIGTLTADNTMDDVAANLTQQLKDQGINDLEVTFADGGFVFTNNSATETIEDGKTKYSGGNIYTVAAADENSAKALGVSESGVAVVSKASDTAAAVTKVSTFAYEKHVGAGEAFSANTKLSDMGIASNAAFSVTVGGETKTFTIDQNTTLSGLASELSKLGVNANYDEGQGRFYINATSSGTDKDFTITSSDPSALEMIGLGTGATKVDATDALVNYNGVDYEQGSNTFSINGLNFTVKDVTTITDDAGNVVKDEPMTLSVETDVDAIYEKIKNFVKEYNSLMEEMNKLYDAESAKDYDMLTDDEKKQMSDKDIESWENKIKDSLLRRDSTLSSVMSMMRKISSTRTEITMSDGTIMKFGLSTLGINTGQYGENGKLHIYGDLEDADFSDKNNKLMELLQSDPEQVLKTLTGVGTEMYKKFQTAMKSSSLSSALTFYNDKEYDTNIKDYDSKIAKLQEKMNTAQDKFYSQFTMMETKMAEMNAQMSYMSSMLG
ncbi:MAG: flagellar filament capping protein FliD [Lachnospiraceae bacterium]|nr:flagellar filament capping protein FliD [Lachnospiraceae bacterium]